MRKPATSWRGGASPRHCACAGNTAPLKEILPRWRALGNTVSDLTGRRFERQISRSKDERVTLDQLAVLFDCNHFHCYVTIIHVAVSLQTYRISRKLYQLER